MLCLSESDIFKALSLHEVMESVESAMILYEKKGYQMPDRMHIDYEGNTLLLMPCFTQNSFGTKLVSVYPQNTQKNIPVVNGIMALNDAKTGVPLALLNGSALTGLRTGAVGGVSIRYLTPEKIQTAGVIGAGVQGFNQAFFASSVRKLSDIYVYDCYPEKIPPFITKLTEIYPGIQIHHASSVEEVLELSQLIITATTSMKPVLPEKEKMLEGKHFVGIGSYKPDMREFPEALFHLLDRVFIDTEHARDESGDIAVPLKNHWIDKNQVFTLGKLIIGQERLRENETTLFKSVGMALFDVVVSKSIYDKALQKGLGQEIKL